MKSYTVTLSGFSAIEAENPLDAAKQLAQIILDLNPNELAYEVEDEETREKFTVDLGESDKDAVLPN